MDTSIKWLKKYINIDNSTDEIASRLTLAGLEAEGFRRLQGVKNVVVGLVEECDSHPNADKLHICKVFDGENHLQVVCGAPNVKKGILVPFARIGAELPSEDGSFKIKPAKLRGVESNGMLCSERELGLTDDHSGLMILNGENIKPGDDVNELLSLEDDIISFNVTPNRPDWLSIIGIARETSALFNKPISLPEIKLEESSKKAEGIEVKISEKSKCPIYYARIIEGLEVAPSPLWLQARLKSAGVRPINNIVDVTNYIMLEWAQPLHAFDIRNIDSYIEVRSAFNGEKIVALDGKEYNLNEDMLLIADKSKPLAIAGVMGGEYTSVMADTETVVLECAYFEPTCVRKTSKKLGLSTDASYRYERGIDFSMTEKLVDYAAMMLAEICGKGGKKASVLKGKLGEANIKFEARKVEASVESINKLLGSSFKSEDMANALNLLGIKAISKNNLLSCTIPAFRNDLSNMQDIAEEVARVLGYENIPSKLPNLSIIQKKPEKHNKLLKIRQVLKASGYYEVLNFSFLAEETLLRFNSNEDDFVKLLNPISKDMAWMRDSIFPAILKNLENNYNSGFSSVKLFEIAKVYKSNGKSELATENMHLCLAVMGDYASQSWLGLDFLNEKKNIDTFFYLKGALETIFAAFNLLPTFEKASDIAFLHPGISANIIINGKKIGFIGKLHPDIADELDLKAPTYISEIDLAELLESNEKIIYKQFSRFPTITRDISFVVAGKVEAFDIVKSIYEKNKLIRDVAIFDIFSGSTITLGCKSLGIRITFQSSEVTLRDEDIQPILEEVRDMLEKNYQAVLR